jgi:uncharacterized protein (TIGR03545 family)
VRVQIFRWKAIWVLLLFLAIFGILAVIFAEPIARDTTEEASTELLGTQVDVGKLDLHPTQPAVDLQALQVANPFVLTRNLLEVDEIRLKLNPGALAEKKLVIENLSIQGMRFGTTRKRPARPPSGGGFAPQAYRAVQQWADQFDVPLLSLTPIDTIRQLALNPSQLTTIREAEALVGRTDSVRKALEQGFQQLDIRPTLDSARALVDRLSRTDPKKLGVDSTRRAIESLRESIRAVEVAKQRLENLERHTRSAGSVLSQGVQTLDRARQKDFAFAKSLLKLPSFSAPEIGTALFGKVSIDRFKQALYWAELAQRYMPPGLIPRPAPGPQRLRASGQTLEFPKARDYPRFLLENGLIDFAIGGSGAFRGAYEAAVRGLTSTPALYGRPAVITARRRAEGSGIDAIDVGAIINHVGTPIHDSARAQLQGVQLPAFDLPGIPFRVDPGTGSSSLLFDRKGSRFFARWAVRSNQVKWVADTAARTINEIERQVGRVLSGLKELEVVAEVRGTLSSPSLSVSSNLDRVIAQRVKALMGEEVARAERMVRTKVDSLVAGRVEPAKRQVAVVQGEANQRVESEKRRVDQLQRELEAQLKRMTGGLVPGVELPKIDL